MKNSVSAKPSELWWLGVVQGIVTLLFGIAALFWPGLTLVTLVYLFSAYVLVWGVVEIVRSLTGMQGVMGTWWLNLIFGIVGLGVGVYLVRHPNVTFATLVLLIGFVLIIRGVFDIVASLFVHMSATAKVMAMIAGIVAVLAGIFVLRQPVTGGVAFVWILGLFSLIMGPLTIALAVDERNMLEESR